ncbi:hypothetical protein RIF29_38333 [Crotalaria pallida]|uniref:Uncharacterized protein n=1 Tax=Crotalaria pallida TaxID=3830 RepID=A0AAN9DZI6_CROPI
MMRPTFLDDDEERFEDADELFELAGVVVNGSYMNALLEQEYGLIASFWSAYNNKENGFESESRHLCVIY